MRVCWNKLQEQIMYYNFQVSDICFFCLKVLTKREQRYAMSPGQLAYPRPELKPDYWNKYE